MEDEFEVIKELELELTMPSTRRDAERLNHILSDDFQEFGKSGRVFTKHEIVALLTDEEPSEIKFSNFRFSALSKESVLVTYKSSCDGVDANRSSIWLKKDGKWQVLHHQGTACA